MYSGLLDRLCIVDVSKPIAGYRRKPCLWIGGFTFPFKIKCYKRNLAAPVGIKYI